MAILTKLTPSALTIARLSLGKLHPQTLTLQLIRLSHGHVMRKRNGQMFVSRIKDLYHFYFIVLGIAPWFLAAAITHIVYGPCELKDYPEEGQPAPRYWQYERTPIQQFCSKYFAPSDMEHHERNLAYYERLQLLGRTRRIDDRVKHLQGEYGDYKGYYYMPVSSQWVDYGRYVADKARDQYELHGYYSH